jgi:hypothetical protein
MAYIEFKHHEYISNLGTNGVKQRVALLGQLDDLYCDTMHNCGLLHDLGGCIDAPELLPSGSTVRGAHQLVNARTQPGTIVR